MAPVMRQSMCSLVIATAIAVSGCQGVHSQPVSRGPSAEPVNRDLSIGPCAVHAVTRPPASVAVTWVKIGFWHGETSIINLIALADGSFIVKAETPGTTNNGPGLGGPGTDYVYRVDASGRILEHRQDWGVEGRYSSIDLTYFFSYGPGGPVMWRDQAGATHTVPGNPDGGLFRDLAGRFWQLVLYSDGRPGALWVSDETGHGSTKIDLGGDSLTAAAAGCDGAVWALASNGHIWRIGAGGQAPRVVMSLPVGTGVFGSRPYDTGRFTAMSDGSVWLTTSRDDQTIPISEREDLHLIHLDAHGPIAEVIRPLTATFSDWAEGPDGALWATELGSGLIRLSTRGVTSFYPAPAAGQFLTQDTRGELWTTCQPALCALTPIW